MKLFGKWKFGRLIPDAPDEREDRQMEDDMPPRYGPAPATGRPTSILMDRRGLSDTPFQDMLYKAFNDKNLHEKFKDRPLPGEPGDDIKDWPEPGSGKYDGLG